MIESGTYHLVGVAGVGMSAVAQALLAAGAAVTGSDRRHAADRPDEVLRKLALAGVRIHAQDGSAVTTATRAVIVSTAIEDDNPDLRAARRLGVPVRHRSQALAALLEGTACIAVSGTSGKSTVTGMIGWVLECLGACPTVVNGAPVLNWRDATHIGNVRIPPPGASPARTTVSGAAGEGLWVVEADESDRSLLNLHPDWAVITNISHDHFPVEEAAALFARFGAQARKGVINMPEDPEVLQGFCPDAATGGSRFTCGGVEFTIPLPGRHNAENALCCVRVCERLGAERERIREALARFQGMERRLERVGCECGITVVDDVAHNPAKIGAAWRTIAAACPRLMGVWRPHGFGPLRLLWDDLVDLFEAVVRPDDRLLVLPVYDAGGSADRRMNSDRLVDALNARGVRAVFVPDVAEVPAIVARDARSGDAVLTLGARDPDLPVLARRILAAVEEARSARGTKR